MSRLRITPWENSQRTVDDLYADMERRISAAPCGNCPVELTSAFLKLCLAQSCGKCVPCRIGLDRLAALLDQLLDGQGSQADLDTILRTAQSIVDSADCAIGFEAAQMVLDGYVAFQDDYLAHVTQGSCTANFKSVPCVELCPAHVDVPGYISLVGEERYDDAIRLIRKDNPFPSVCGLVWWVWNKDFPWNRAGSSAGRPAGGPSSPWRSPAGTGDSTGGMSWGSGA